MFELFHYSFMIRAFVAGGIIAVIAPLVGSFLVIKRFSLVADTLAHIALTGVAIGVLIGIQPLFTTIVITMFIAGFIEYIRTKKNIPGDIVLAMFLPGGLAVSVVIMNFAHGFNTDLFSYLFGSVTTVQPQEIWLMLFLGIAVITTIVLLYKKLLYTSFDEESARVNGIPVGLINLTLMLLTAIIVSLSMRVVGILLIGALMVIPITTALQISRSFKHNIILGIFFALVAVFSGLLSAYYLNLPAGGTIVLISLGLFGIVGLIKKRV